MYTVCGGLEWCMAAAAIYLFGRVCLHPSLVALRVSECECVLLFDKRQPTDRFQVERVRLKTTAKDEGKSEQASESWALKTPPPFVLASFPVLSSDNRQTLNAFQTGSLPPPAPPAGATLTRTTTTTTTATATTTNGAEIFQSLPSHFSAHSFALVAVVANPSRDSELGPAGERALERASLCVLASQLVQRIMAHAKIVCVPPSCVCVGGGGTLGKRTVRHSPPASSKRRH
jgi:hypothetical protein